jgi:hypothetical protein
MTGDQDGIPWQEIVTIENPVGYELSVQNECWLYCKFAARRHSLQIPGRQRKIKNTAC